MCNLLLTALYSLCSSTHSPEILARHRHFTDACLLGTTTMYDSQLVKYWQTLTFPPCSSCSSFYFMCCIVAIRFASAQATTSCYCSQSLFSLILQALAARCANCLSKIPSLRSDTAVSGIKPTLFRHLLSSSQLFKSRFHLKEAHRLLAMFSFCSAFLKVVLGVYFVLLS